jgi:uncharacterized membrane protein
MMLGKDNQLGKPRSHTLLAMGFVGSGTLHFMAPGVFERIMPPYMPLHRELVYLSGAGELFGGLGLLSGRTRRIAGTWLVLLLLAVWPANLQMLLDARAAGKPRWWTTLLWLRLPAQIPLMLWVWCASRRPS